jgi:hypothetical protein
MKSILTLKCAGAVLAVRAFGSAERAAEFFDVPHAGRLATPFMLWQVPAHLRESPAVTHVMERHACKRFAAPGIRAIMSDRSAQRGVPVLSFNIAGELIGNAAEALGGNAAAWMLVIMIIWWRGNVSSIG